MRLVGVDGQQIGVVSINEALALAEEANVDLVEMVANANPPVCRLMDYGKFLFEQGKKKAQAKKTKNRHRSKRLNLDL